MKWFVKKIIPTLRKIWGKIALKIRNDKVFNRKLLVDLDSHGKKYVVCKGGKGGIGNFTKRTLRKGDRLLQGSKGEEKELVLGYIFKY